MNDAWGTVPQWASALAACTGVGVAIFASRSWKKSLKEKRTDDILTALIDFTAEVGAIQAAVGRRAPSIVYGARIDSLYMSIRSLQKAYVVAQRSYTLTDQKILDLHAFTEHTTNAARNLSEQKVLTVEFEAAKGYFGNLRLKADEFAQYVREAIAAR